MEETKNAILNLEHALENLSHEDISKNAQEGTLAAHLHAFYNTIGLKEGWLQKEYATPLSEQDPITQLKNIEAAKDVLRYWTRQLKTAKTETEHLSIIDTMKKVTDYEKHRGDYHLEAAAESQHEQWKMFVKENQPERITPGDPKFREKNYQQFLAKYSQLSEQEKDQDRLVVAVITKHVLGMPTGQGK